MSDTFGAITLPGTPPAPGDDSVGDPLLARLSDFLAAVINAEGAEEWEALAPGSKPVKSVFTHNPNEFDFNEKYLPALFLDRVSGDDWEWFAEDYDISHDTLRLLWIFPNATQDKRRARSGFINRVVKECIHAIELGRHPAYVLDTDQDPAAATLGTNIYNAASIFAIDWAGYSTEPTVIKTSAEPRRYVCVNAKLKLQERRILDPDSFPAASGLDVTITTPDGAHDLSVGKF